MKKAVTVLTAIILVLISSAVSFAVSAEEVMKSHRPHSSIRERTSRQG